MRLIWIFLVGLLAAFPSAAQEKRFALAAPAALQESGFLKFVLPRFSLKTGIRITLVAPAEPHDAAFGEQGVPVFKGMKTWSFNRQDNAFAEQFETWLLSDVGKRTVESFQVDGVAVFSADVAAAKVAVATAFEGDAVKGAELSLKLCGRCHVVGEINRMKAIGSTPSFAVLRTFADWENRFTAFYTLKPHAAFTQVEDVTPPFSDQSPPPIVPIEMTLDDLDAMLAFIAQVPPADLGAPIVAQ